MCAAAQGNRRGSDGAGESSRIDEGGISESNWCWPVSHAFEVRGKPRWKGRGRQTLRALKNLTLKRQIKAMRR